jgi:hypothetical protein
VIPVLIELPEAKFVDLAADNMGVCLGCGEYQGGCEPDAHSYECESCGARRVYGMEEALIMGAVTFVD